jgi:hypothetical protein
MRTIFTILSLLGISLGIKAQNQVINGTLSVKDLVRISGSNNQILHLRPNSGYSGYIYWAENGVAERGILGFKAGSGDLIYRSGANTFTSGVERFRITSGGYLGIGTDNPKQKLEINGNINIGSDLTDYGTKKSTYGNKLFFLGAHNNTDPLWMARYNVSDAPNASEIRVNIGDDPNHYGDKFVVGVTDTDTWNPRFVVQGNGKVGIGTIEPDYMLDVIGTIRAQEIKVDLDGADFVFEDDYNLRTIEEVEDFVTKNKHLPEIEPASEMEANGTNLGELNSKLLQKIEELTLYLIEQNKLNQNQQEKIDKLEQELNSLKRK